MPAASVWSEHLTKEGRVYYYNRSTKQSSWEKPADFDGDSAADAGGGGGSKKSSSTSSSSGAASSVEWEELWDPKNERAYYYNRATRKTQWLRPEGVEIKPYVGAGAATSSSSSSHQHGAKKDKHSKKSGDRHATASGTTTKHQEKSEGSEQGGEGEESSAQSTRKHDRSKEHHHSDKHEETASAVGVSSVKKQAEEAEKASDGQTAASASIDHNEQPVAATPKPDTTHHKKKKKKTRRERLELDGPRKKRRKDSDKRMIICDDEDQMNGAGGIVTELPEDETEAARLLQELSKTDAIMEANVLGVINSFLRAHQEPNGPEILVEKLSSSYRGHAQMISLVASWLDALPVSKTTVESKVTFDVSEGAVIENKGATWEASEEILYRHLKDLITDNYDPNLVRIGLGSTHIYVFVMVLTFCVLGRSPMC